MKKCENHSSLEGKTTDQIDRKYYLNYTDIAETIVKVLL